MKPSRSKEVKRMTSVEHRDEAVKPIAPFQTVEEEAMYWGTHSAVDGIDERTVVGFHPARKTDSLTIRFEPEEIQRIRTEANQRGIGPSTLVRMWVMEHLKHQHQGQ